MIIELLPSQIPELWEVIKLGAIRSSEVPEASIPAFSNRLLQGLLSGKVSCLIRLGEGRTVLGVLLSQVQEDLITGERELNCWGIYSFRVIDEESMLAGLEVLKKVAKANKCDRMITMSRHPRVWTLFEGAGWTELTRLYVYPIKEV